MAPPHREAGGSGDRLSLGPRAVTTSWRVSLCLASAGLLGGCPAFGYGDLGGAEPFEGSRRPRIEEEGGLAGGDSGMPQDGGTDASTAEGGLDGATDASVDGSPDGSPDDGGLDASGDGAADAADEAAVDAMTADGGDASTDAGDASADGGDAAVACAPTCEPGSYCEDGACTPATCATGFAECDGDGDMVCETNLADDPLHCGDCDVVCPANGGTAICEGNVCDTRCDLSGTFALKLTAPATWVRSGQVDSGSGTFTFWLRLRATHDANEAAVEVLECGHVGPPIHAWVPNEDHRLIYPNSLYDAEVLSSVSTTLTLGDSSPDSSLDLPAVAMQLGVELDDPLNDPWPATAAGLPEAQRVDADADGDPGVTASYSNADGYEYPRTSTSLFTDRAAEAHVAVRWSFSLAGGLTDCDSGKGDATVFGLDLRVLGCREANDTLCTSSEANHLDTNLPDFQFGAADYVLSRVAEDASCAAVRAALP